MSQRQSILLLVGAVLVVGTMSFVTGRLMASRRQSEAELAGWLYGAPVSVQEAERRFERDVQRLTETVNFHKNELAALLVDPGSTDAEILTQVELVLESNEALMRAVGTHLVGLRNNLPPGQRQRLMQSCVDSLEGRMQRRYRWREGLEDDAGWGGGEGRYGRGLGGNGFGPGRGRLNRAGRAGRGGRGGMNEPADNLQLTAEQVAFAQEHDPGFSEDSAYLKAEVAAAYASLLMGLQDAQVDEEELGARLESLIEAHNSLERRVAQYVVMIRPLLSVQQRQRLAGLSRGRPRHRAGGFMSNDLEQVGPRGAVRFFGRIVGED